MTTLPSYDKNSIKEEEKRLYEEYKKKLAALKKSQNDKEKNTSIFTKGLLPIYVLYLLSLGPTNGNEISKKIGKRTNEKWVPSTGGIYPLLKRMEADNLIEGQWDNPNKKFQKTYILTEKGFHEFESKKAILKDKIKDSLEVFEIIFHDLYKE
ncbi:PadR family transcriptional regulator [Clostridium sp. SM-530-WT-3G]|uniref:PadR family transcriptional regulator n=1 Tax=Clostridium sp. SM-530-WT-3G TaxID=2725303 RepID=UPI00145EC88C|nr:PadR family transcriptional regulator [Clostridium sp. SM-530-WT-3G]NME81643.1 PadR family transcriptional regulator [Clostridium sp. SM-530-WT-3G]